MLRTMIPIFCLIVPSMGLAEQQPTLTADFESGRILPNQGPRDAGFIRTLPENQRGDEIIGTAQGGCGENSNCDMKVIQTATVDGQNVSPRSGNYFLQMLLDIRKDYTGLNGGLPKPRNSLAWHNDVYRWDYDVERWIGFSLFIPVGFEDETENAGITFTEIGSDSSSHLAKLMIGKRGNDPDSRWYLEYELSDTSPTNDGKTIIDMGSIEPDKGKWTDFVIRLRANPFRTRTNPADLGIKGAFDREFAGNKGILQVWKSAGNVDAQGNRRMANKIDIVDRPVGLVPATVQGKSQLKFDARLYKGQWQGNKGKTSSVVGPQIWVAWDEIRFGDARDGVGYQDVNPSRLPCTEACTNGDDISRPLPPVLND